MEVTGLRHVLPFAGFWKFFVRAPNIHGDVTSVASEKEGSPSEEEMYACVRACELG